MGKTAAIPMDKEIQNFLFIFTGQQYKFISCEFMSLLVHKFVSS